MKLNLLPTYVGKGRQVVLAVFVGVLLILLSAGFSFTMITNSHSQLAEVQAQAHDYEKPVTDAKEYADKADNVVAPLREITRDINLANAMNAHNDVYPKFYNSIFPYIPSFFRVTSMTATPIDANTVNLAMTGVIKTHQQYADLMLALLRSPNAGAVSRSGFTATFPVVPNVTLADPNPVTRQPNEPVLPKDPLQRLNALIASGGVHAFKPAGGFGSGVPGPRGAMPEYQLVTVTVVLPAALQTPNPRATLSVGGGGGGGATLVRGGAGGGKLG